MRNVEVANLQTRLNETIMVGEEKKTIFHNLIGEKFLYAVNRNKHLTTTYINEMRENFRLQSLPKYPKHDTIYIYQEKLKALQTKYSDEIKDLMNKVNEEKKSEKPNEQVIKDLEDVLDGLREKKEKEVKEGVEQLKIEYKEPIEQSEACQKDWQKLLDSEATINLHMLDRENIPDDINDDQYQIIISIIKGFFDKESTDNVKKD